MRTGRAQAQTQAQTQIGTGTGTGTAASLYVLCQCLFSCVLSVSVCAPACDTFMGTKSHDNNSMQAAPAQSRLRLARAAGSDGRPERPTRAC